jgi:hypothetical protein
MSVKNPGGLLDQWNLLGAIINADWSTRLDHKVAFHVIDNLRREHGNSRAALRYLEKATGALRPSIITSVRRLTEHGAISVARQGKGTRPTEYGLNFDFGTQNPSGMAGNTSTSGIVGNTSEVLRAIPLESPSGIAGDTESYLRSSLTSELTESRNQNTPAAIAPPDGLTPVAAHAAVAPKEETKKSFDEIWDAWIRHDKRPDAKDAYKAIAPSPALHQRILEAAKAWTETYAAIGTQRRYQRHLHTWLKGEGWLEDLPVAYESPKDAAIARKAKKQAPDKPVVRDAPRDPESGLSIPTENGQMPPPDGLHKHDFEQFPSTSRI